MKKPERNEQRPIREKVLEKTKSEPIEAKEFKAGVNKANDNINNNDKSPSFRCIDIQQPSTNKENTNYETKKRLDLHYSVSLLPSKNQADESIDIQSNKDSSVSSPTLNTKSINHQEKNFVTSTPQKEYLLSSYTNESLNNPSKDKKTCDDNDPKNNSLLANKSEPSFDKRGLSQPIVYKEDIEKHSKVTREQKVDSKPTTSNKLSSSEKQRDINIYCEDPNLRHFDTSIHSASNHDSKQLIDFTLR